MPTHTDHTDMLTNGSQIDDTTAAPEMAFDESGTSGQAEALAEAEDADAPNDDDCPATSPHDDEADQTVQVDSGKKRRFANGRYSWTRVAGYGILPALALLLAVEAGYLKWQDSVYHESQVAAAQSVPAATETAIAMLSYHAGTVEKELTAARDRLTGSFRDEYTKLINDVVIPGSKEKGISVAATVPAAASVSASASHAVVVVFVNQTTMIGSDPPTDMASSVLMTLDKEGGRWLVSKFEPV